MLCWVSQSCELFVTSWTVACQAPLSMGILQTRILEWVAMPFSRGSSQPRSPSLQADSLSSEPPGKPKLLEWVAYPFSRGTSWPKNQTRVSCFAGGFFTSWATREVHNYHYRLPITFDMKLNPNEFLESFRVIHMIVFFYWDKLSREGNVECLSSSIVI